jgi:hypothetical protein
MLEKKIQRKAAEDTAKKETEIERVHKLAEKERLAAQKTEREKLRA